MSSLTGKVALITGAGSGIGRASALDMAEKGAAVMCADINSQAAEGTVGLIQEAGGRADAYAFDVSKGSEVQQAIDTTASRMGGLDIIFNNAGVGGGYGWNDTIAINLTGVYHGLLMGAPFLAENGGGAIINTASIAGLVGLITGPVPADLGEVDLEEGAGAYIAAKHGVVGLTKHFALNFGCHGVRVNAIAPGYIETPMTAEFREDDETKAFLTGLHPMGRLGQAKEIAAGGLFFSQ